MVKKLSQKKSDSVQRSVPTPPSSQVVFPEVSPKTDLECTTILEDQIIIIDVCHIQLKKYNP
jgi:hypothetical protein